MTSNRSPSGQLLDGGETIVDSQGLGPGVNRRSLDVLLRGICPQHRRAKPGHGLRQQTAAAADVEEAQTRKGQALKRIACIAGGDLFAYVFDPQRVEPVQHRESCRSGFHHSAARAENFSTSAGSMLTGVRDSGADARSESVVTRLHPAGPACMSSAGAPSLGASFGQG